jgi:hypothetical protein
MVDKQIGRNGLLAVSGNVTHITETSILVPPFTAVQKGLIYTKDTTTTLSAVPIKDAPFYLTVSSPSPTNADNLIWSYAYSEEDITDETVLFAAYDGANWRNMKTISIDGILDEIGNFNLSHGLVGPFAGLKTSVVDTNYVTSPGGLVDKQGERQIFLSELTNPVVAMDSEYGRVDRILYRRPTDFKDRVGGIQFELGGTYHKTPGSLLLAPLELFSSPCNVIRVVFDSTNVAHVFATVVNGLEYDLKYVQLDASRQNIIIPETTIFDGLSFDDFDIAIDKTDNIHVVYSALNIGVASIFYAQVDITGAVIVSPTTVDSSSGVCKNPKCAIDNLDEKVYIVFQGLEGLQNQIYFASRNVDGGWVATTQKKIASTLTGNFQNPSICVSNDVIVFVAWEDSVTGSIFYQRFDKYGVIIDLVPTKVSEGVQRYDLLGAESGVLNDLAQNPKIIVADNQEIFVAFEQNKGGSAFGVSLWTQNGAYMCDFFDADEDFTSYDIHIDRIFNDPTFFLTRTNGTDLVRLHNKKKTTLEISVNMDLGFAACIAKDKLGSYLNLWTGTVGTCVKTPAEAFERAFVLDELDSDVLIARMIQAIDLTPPQIVVIDWIKNKRPGSLYDFLLAYGGQIMIDWGVTTPGYLTIGPGLKILDMFTGINYTLNECSVPMGELDALYVTLGTESTIDMHARPLSHIPWDSNAAVLGVVMESAFNPALLGVAGLTKLVIGEKIVFGEDLPQSTRTRLGILDDTESHGYQLYLSTIGIEPSDTYPWALSNLDIMAGQNPHIRLVGYTCDWEFEEPDTLRFLNNCNVQIPSRPLDENIILAQSIVLANDGDIAYVELNRVTPDLITGNPVREVFVAASEDVPIGRNTFIIARRTATGIEVNGNAITYTDRLSVGQTNNIVSDGDKLEDAIKKLDVRQDVVKRVRLIDRNLTALPSIPAIIDEVPIEDGDKVLFANPLINGIYQLVGSSWSAALYEFGGSQSPSSKDLVMVYDGPEINRTIWAYDSLKSWYRATTTEDLVPVRAMDLTTTTLPLVGPVVVDGVTILEGELVLFGNTALNRVYRVSYSGPTLFEELNVFVGNKAPRDGSTVLVQDGTASDVVWEYDQDTTTWRYLTLTTQNKEFLGLNSPSKSGGEFSGDSVNNVITEGQSIEDALISLDLRQDVVKRVRAIDRVLTTLPTSLSPIDGVTPVVGDKILFGSAALNGIYKPSSSIVTTTLVTASAHTTPPFIMIEGRLIGQTFTPVSPMAISSALFYVESAPTSIKLVAKIYATSGGFPTGAALGTSAIVTRAASAKLPITFNFGTPVNVSSGVKYAIVVSLTEPPVGSGFIQFYGTVSSSYSGGNDIYDLDGSGTWYNDSGDYYVELNSSGEVVSWSKLYEFGGAQSPTSKDLVLVCEGSEINRTLWSYDATKKWYRTSTISDTISVRAVDLAITSTSGIVGQTALTLDGQVINNGDLILLGNKLLNRVYKVSGVGISIALEEMNLFTGDAAPRDGAQVIAQDGTVSDVVYEYNAEADSGNGAWIYLTLTAQNKTYLGLNSPSKSGGQYNGATINNIVSEGQPLEEAIKSLDLREDVLKRVRAVDLTSTVLPTAVPTIIDSVSINDGDAVLFGSSALNGVYKADIQVGLPVETYIANFMGGFNSGSGGYFEVYPPYRSGTAFNHNGANITSIKLEMFKQGAPTGNIKMTLHSDNAGSPGTLLATSSDVPVSSITGTSSAKTMVTFPFSGASLPAAKYWFIVSASTGLVSNPSHYVATFGNSTGDAPYPLVYSTSDGVGPWNTISWNIAFQVISLSSGTTLSWSKLYAFGGLQDPSTTEVVLVREGTALGKTVWQYNSSINPPWHRLAGAPENIWTGADAVTAPTFNGTLSSSDSDVAKALLTIDKYFRALQLREHPTIKRRVIVTGARVEKTDGTFIQTTLNHKMLDFSGAEIDFLYGQIYKEDGVTLIGTFTPASIPTAGLYQWYSIGFLYQTSGVDNTIYPVIKIDVATATGVSPTAAPKPSLTTEYVVGNVYVKSTGTTPAIETIPQSAMVQVNDFNFYTMFDRMADLETTVILHSTEINAIQNAIGSILANKPEMEVFTATAGQTLFNVTLFEFENDNTRLDIEVTIGGRWQIISALGTFTDGSWRKNSTTQIEFAEGLSAGSVVTVTKRDAGAIYANTIKYQRFIAGIGGQSLFTLDPLVFKVNPDDSVIDAEYTIDGRWQIPSLLGNFTDGSVRKNTATQVETATPVPAGQEFVVYMRTPNGAATNGGGADLSNINEDLEFVTPRSVGTEAGPANSVILRDQMTIDIWELTVSNGVLGITKIN